MSRMLRTTVPSTRKQRAPRVPDRASIRAKDQQLKTRQKRNFDSHHGVRELSPLSPGDTVWMPDRNSEAKVSSEADHRSYEVASEDGTFRRNRKDLIALPDLNTNDSITNDSNTNDSITDNSNAGQPLPVRRSGRVAQAPDRFDPSWT